MAGIKITLRDPEDASKLIHSEFATARGVPEMNGLLAAIAKADTEESVAAKKRELADVVLMNASNDDDADVAGCALQKATEAVEAASLALFESIRDFLIAGYTKAGATEEIAENLVALTPIERLPEIKAKCLFGAGCVDFTKGEGQ